MTMTRDSQHALCRRAERSIRSLALAGLFVVFAAANLAHAGSVISSIEKISGNATDIALHQEGLSEQVEAFTDRNHRLVNVPDALKGSDLVRLSNSDKFTMHQVNVTFDHTADFYVAIDDRIRPQPLPWMQDPAKTGLPGVFSDSGLNVDIDEIGQSNADVGNIDNTFSLWVTSAPPGTYSLFEQNLGRELNMYIPFASISSATSSGDLDGDGTLSASDIDVLTSAIIDGSVDSQFDLNDDQIVDLVDHSHWVKELKNTWIGDANMDGEFSSEDMVAVFQAGKYELDVNAGWSDGDWNGDRRFGTEDMVAAFQDGGYELGPVGAVSAVPEPSCAVLLGIGMVGLCRLRQRPSCPA